MPANRLPAPGFPAEIPSPATLEELHEVMRRCTRCELYLSRTQVVPGAGNPNADLLLVGEAPGAKEDELGIPFVGASGRLLDSMLAAAEIDREEVFIANVVRSRPPGNRPPKPKELRACAGWLAEQVRIIRPKLIVTLGRFALQHFIPTGKITQLQGKVQEVEYGPSTVSVLPLLHPSAVLRDPRQRDAYEKQFVALGKRYRG